MRINIEEYKHKGLLQGDMTIWTILIVLCVISIIEVYSASTTMTYGTGKYWSPVMEHGSFVFVGLFVTWLVHQVPCKLFKLFSLILVLLSFVLLIWALVGGASYNDAGRWIKIFGRTFQPSEIAKLALISYIAYVMSHSRDAKNQIAMRGIKMIAVVVIPFTILIGMENFSTAGILLCVVMFMLIIGGAPKKVLAPIFISGALLVGTVGTVMFTMSKETAQSLAQSYHPLHRLPVWVGRLHNGNALPEDPKDYDVNSNQQVAHAKIAVATCNFVGHGPGKSVERDYLPQAFSDFIFAIIIEEGGIESALLVIVLYLLLLYRSWRIASRCARPFPAFLIMGLSFMIVFQALINMGVAVGLLPVTGQTLPLVSRGGTSYIITCVYMGMILSVSRSARKTGEPVPALAQQMNEEEIKE